VKIGLGKFWGFMEGMIRWVASWLDRALYPVIFVDYLATWSPELGRGRHVAYSSWDGMYSLDSHWLAAMAFMAPLAYLNARGSRLVGDTSVGLLIVLLVPLVVLVILGFHHWLTTPGVEPLQPFTAGGLSPRQAAGAALAIVMWNYVSFDAVSTRVVRSTTRDVPIRLPCSSAFLSSW
jgi:amino acid transporter